MSAEEHSSSLADRFLPQDVKMELNQIFDALPYEVPLYLFSSKAGPQEDTHVARDLLAAFQELSKRIKFKEYDLSHKLAKKWEVTRAPTIVFAPEWYRIKYLGVPLGEEGRTLVEALIMLGLRSGRMSDHSRRVTAGIEGERKVRVFVSSTCPYCPQQAVNAIKAAIEMPELVSVEIIDTGFNPDLAELYSAFSVPQTFANDILIAKGAQPEELFLASLQKMEEQSVFIPESDAKMIETDLLIIGGGPAGLTAGIYAARSGLKTAVVERDILGGQVAATPIVENYPGIAHIGGKNLVDIMVAHALEYVDVFPREAVLEIRPGEPFEVRSTLRQFTARAVLFATGASHQRLGVPGEDRFAGRGVSYCSTCDGPLFKGKTVAMVGGGNSAVTEALHLHNIGAKVTVIHRRDSLRAQEHLVQDLHDKKIPILWNTEIKEVRGQEKVTELVIFNNQSQKTETLPFDGLFIAIG
ncbi:MAG: FAD-dependent oxidoreductase, partial [Pseudomonadota bacterium]